MIWKDVDVTCEGAGWVEEEEVVIVTVRPDWNPVPSTVIVRDEEDEATMDGLMPLIVSELLPLPVDWVVDPPHPAMSPKTIKRAMRVRLFMSLI